MKLYFLRCISGLKIEIENDVNYTYDLAKGNYVKMRNIIQQADWSQLDHSNVEQCWSIIKRNIHRAMVECIPRVKRTKNSRINPIWMNGLIRRNVKRKYNLYNKYLNSLSVEDHRRYIKMRNECNRVIRMSKRKYEINLSEESKTSPKLFWKYVQSKVKSASGISQLKSESGHLSVTNAEKANTLN